MTVTGFSYFPAAVLDAMPPVYFGGLYADVENKKTATDTPLATNKEG